MILYRIHRLLILFILLSINKLIVLLNGVKCGKGFRACGCVFIRNVGYMSFGGHCIILKGVPIGDEAVIGASSVVTKDVPPGEIWAANPAKFIRKL